jgi:hypothetical protein
MINKKWLSDQINAVVDNEYMTMHFYNLLYLIMIDRFIWKHLPKNIDTDFIEKKLCDIGELAFIKHPLYGFQVTYCIGENINMYERPQKYYCFTENNVINDYFDAKDIVIIRNNKLSQPSHDFINMYAKYLGVIKKMKEVNLNAIKTPVLITCDEDQILTLKNIYAQYEGNMPVIFGKKALDSEAFQVLKTDAPYILDKLDTETISTMNECLTFQGINTTPEKKERLISDEVNANNDMVNICLSIFLNSRLQAIDEINNKWGDELKEKYDGLIELDLAEYCKEKIKHVSREKNNDDLGGSENE